MYFLEKIDLIYKNECEQNQIPNDAEDYSVFIPLDITDQSYSYHFLIMKGEKAKLQIVSGKQRVYLSDSQIIQTILNMSKADIDWFLSQFVLLYQGQGTPICFKIEQESFLGSGIKPYPSKKPLLLMSDTAIDYPCFCLLLNYIFFKDQCHEKMAKKELFSKQTLCKLISVVDYYAYHSLRSKRFLKDINYPLNRDISMAEKRSKDLFKKSEVIKRFEISDFL